MDTRRLYRSNTDKVFSGVCGGLGSYFEMDPILFRVLFVFLAVVSGGSGIIIYLILIFVIPEAPKNDAVTNNNPETDRPDKMGEFVKSVQDNAQSFAESIKHKTMDASRRRTILALGIIAIGLVAFANQFWFFHWLRWDVLWPLLIVGVGLLILIKSNRK